MIHKVQSLKAHKLFVWAVCLLILGMLLPTSSVSIGHTAGFQTPGIFFLLISGIFVFGIDQLDLLSVVILVFLLNTIHVMISFMLIYRKRLEEASPLTKIWSLIPLVYVLVSIGTYSLFHDRGGSSLGFIVYCSGGALLALSAYHQLDMVDEREESTVKRGKLSAIASGVMFVLIFSECVIYASILSLCQ